MISSNDQRYLDGLRESTLQILREVIGGPGPVALLDAPNQRNVGDSLIWAGELEYLEQLGLDVRYTADIWGLVPADLRRRMPSGTILIHGGGNFGDIWMGHQQHRELILGEFADYRVVQLPQSIWFSDPGEAARANDAMSAHPDFIALLRDPESMSRAAEQVPGITTQFCYDMALGYSPPAPRPGRRTSALVLARADKEGASGLVDVGGQWTPGLPTTVTDWVNDGLSGRAWSICRKVTRAHRRYATARRSGRVRPLPMVDPVAEVALRLINTINIRGGTQLYADARVAVVDRLHAHILACLLGVPHVLLDNNYGKLGAVYRAYSGEFSTANYATDAEDARAMVGRVLEATDGGAH